jgi:branched-subunit amino acid ABC-type transport system permease component
MIIAGAVVAPAGFLLSVPGVTPFTGTSQGLLAFVATITAGRRRPLSAPLVALLLVCVGSVTIRWCVFEILIACLCLAVALVVYRRLAKVLQLRAWQLACATGLATAAVAAAVVLAGVMGPSIHGHFLNMKLPSAFKPIAPYGVVVTALLWRPRGLLAGAQDREV